MENRLLNVKIWRDTNGEQIQAHGGSIIKVDGKYYWYGENKQYTTGIDTDIWHWGVRCYSSLDLIHWQDEGLIVHPNEKDKFSSLHPSRFMDRPHIVYNEKNKEYCLWLKIMGDAIQEEHFTILVSKNIVGPYEIVEEFIQPINKAVGDFDIQIDSKTQKGYLITQKPHESICIFELSDDYKNVTDIYSEHFIHSGPPLSREAPAHFMHNGKHYFITSGTTGYFPNPAEYAISDDWHGPYRVMGNPCVDDISKTTFNSQISSVFTIPEKNIYIAIADRWRPELPEKYGDDFLSGRFYSTVAEKFSRIFGGTENIQLTEEDIEDMKINSSLSQYIWFLLEFEGENLIIRKAFD